jgi:2-oxoglutarate ferredoxin oxidoreductase subunit delta
MPEKPKKSFRLDIDQERCKGCQLCIEFCPKNVLELSVELNKKGTPFSSVMRQEDCIGCRACTRMCPDTCIELYELEPVTA